MLLALTITCWQSPRAIAAEDTATTFHVLTPARLLDTRTGPGYTTIDGQGAGVGPVGPGQTVQLAVRGRGGVPLNGVGSVAFNVTATESTSATFVTLYPGGGVRPNASTVNVVPGQTVANSAIVRLGPDGTVSVFNQSGDVHLVIDVLAWVPIGPAYTGVEPARLLDTRTGPGIATVDGQFLGGGARGAGTTLDLVVLGRGGLPAPVPGILSPVGSVVLNLTVTEPSASTYVTVHPTGAPQPTASNINVDAGATAASMVVVPVGADGGVSLFQFAGAAHLIVDVIGWFPALSPTFIGIVPTRFADTRAGAGFTTIDGLALGAGPVGAGGTLVVPIRGRGEIPTDAAGAVILSVVVTEPTAGTFVTVYPTGVAKPVASNVNARAGQTVANTVLVPLGADGSVTLFQFAGSAHLVVDVLGWFPPSIDLPEGVTTLVSAKPDGRSSTTAGSRRGVVSGNGQYIAFESAASDLVPGGTGGVHVFVRDRINGTTERVSVSSQGAPGVGGSSEDPAISPDGRFVVFESDATNLAPLDFNGLSDVYLHDRQTDTTERVSVPNLVGPTGSGNEFSGDPEVSADGRYVTFVSGASNLVAGDVNNAIDVFRRDRLTQTTVLVSVSSLGAQSTFPAFNPSMSADGRYVVFESAGASYIVGDTNTASDVFLRDVLLGTTTRLSVAANGVAGGNDDSRAPTISGDGSTVSFSSMASNLVRGDSNDAIDVFVRVLATGKTERVSVSSTFRQTKSSITSSRPAPLSFDGRFVAFNSDAPTLVDDDLNGVWDVFVRDRTRAITYRASVATDGSEVDVYTQVWSISGDGSVVPMDTGADLTTNDGNGLLDVIIRVYDVS